jgi:hypothetical protein
VGPIAGLDVLVKRKIPCHSQGSKPGPSSLSLSATTTTTMMIMIMIIMMMVVMMMMMIIIIIITTTTKVWFLCPRHEGI